MNDLIAGFESPIDEWVVVARELYRQDKEATMWDLTKIMYEYKTGCDFPEITPEEDIVNLHIQGYSKSAIAKELDTTTGEVSDILGSIGFSGFRSAPEYSPKQVGEFFIEEKGSEPELSRYMQEKCLDEYMIYLKWKEDKNA
jgi:hypothetical protein